ncbi:hypothetical protein Glove_123g27 [Diversispora epigaea]|uniref:Uncharacterized protein n=1 Tax=Diversispora epigaea TaxID=1348612 RepID=A0A397J2H0_9GLOM|nr:hypothetical protein Glove_123g27 [Diversispora epigaea]
MTSHVFHVLELNSLQPNETVINFPFENRENPNQNQSQLATTPTEIPSVLSPWIPSEKLKTLQLKFELYILAQYPCVPCSFCGKLMYSEKSKWIQKDPNYQYPLIKNYPNMSFIYNPNPPPNRIPVCNTCHTNPLRNYPPYLKKYLSQCNGIIKDFLNVQHDNQFKI